MGIVNLSPSVIEMNLGAVSLMRRAQFGAGRAANLLGHGDSPQTVSPIISKAAQAAWQAHEAASSLGSLNILEPAFRRYSVHAARALERAAGQSARGGDSVDLLNSVTRSLDDARIDLRLGMQAAKRSLATPTARSVDGMSSAQSSTALAAAGDSLDPTYVDGQWLDSLGFAVPAPAHGSRWDDSGLNALGYQERGSAGGTWDAPDYSGTGI